MVSTLWREAFTWKMHPQCKHLLPGISATAAWVHASSRLQSEALYRVVLPPQSGCSQAEVPAAAVRWLLLMALARARAASCTT